MKYIFIGKFGQYYKTNANCKDEEKIGKGPGSCSFGLDKDKIDYINHKVSTICRIIPINNKMSTKEKQVAIKKRNERIKQEIDSPMYARDNRLLQALLSKMNDQNNQYIKPENSNKFSITKQQKEELQEYTMSGYSTINKYLRSGEVNDDSFAVKNSIKILDSIFNDAKLNDDMIVYRGIDINTFNQIENNFKVGSHVTFPAFTSTSSDRITASSFSGGDETNHHIIMEIKLPKGCKAISVEEYSKWNEKEILLNRGMTFRIVGNKTIKPYRLNDDIKETIITLEAII